MNILIADDNEDARIVLKKTLEHEGYCVEAACNGKEALFKLKASCPDMIISDILMPEMDGFRFCGAIKSHKRFKKIPFIFYTATYLDPKDERLAIGLGAARYIEKPMETEAFLDMIRGVIREYKEGTLEMSGKTGESESALFKMYEESISKKLEEKISELGLYKSIFKNSKDAIAIIDPDGKYLEQNSAHQALIQYSDTELRGKTPAIHLSEQTLADIFKQLSEKGMYFGEILSRTKSGKQINLELLSFPIFDQNRNIKYYVGIKRDITRRKRTDSLESGHRKILELISEGKASQREIFERITRLAELHSSDVRASILLLKGNRICDGVAPNMPEAYNRLIDGLEIGPTVGSCGTAMYRKSRVVVSDVSSDPLWADYRHFGAQYGFRACWSEPIIGAKGNVLGSFALYREAPGIPGEKERHLIESMSHLAGITIERKQQEEQLIHQAHFDRLTGLPNRFLALDRLSQLLNDARRNNTLVAVLFLDLDDFKKVNDSLGHETGDRLLIEVAERLRGVARRGDTIGRLGGDEFIILLGGLSDAADTRPSVKNLLAQFKDTFNIEGRALILTASVGITLFPGDGDNASDLLRNADSAMYHAKKLGRNTAAYFTDAMNREVSRRLALEEQMHGALARKEFTVVYQPQLEVNSGKMSGAEALLRWSNPALGSVSPLEFIPLAEKTGLIVSLGQFVLEKAVQMTARLQEAADFNFRMAVNLSPRQFRDPDLLSFIEKTLEQAGLSGASLEVELTEGVLMSGFEHTNEVLSTLSKMGVQIAMDDFGTGYSSLSYLRRYHFHVLKIDQSFVRDIAVDPSDRALIDATIAMAHGLNLKVVAEGVETEEQLAYLRKRGCDYAQGYLFAKPMSGNQVLEWMTKRKEQG